jgi:lysyl-tRNA synthetase class 2
MRLRLLGRAAYRSKYEFTHTLDHIPAQYTAKTGEELEQARVNGRVAGRIMAIRLMGKAGFAHLQQDGNSRRKTRPRYRVAPRDRQQHSRT